MSQQPYKRRTYFIKKDFQFRFIVKFCLLVLLGAAVSTTLLLLFSRNTLTSTFENSRLVVKTTAQAILPAALLTNLITLGLITLAAIFVVLYVSHRIAGPLFRFEKEIKAITEGDLTGVIHLRSRDQITDLAVSLNQMTANIREKLILFKGEIATVSDTLRKAGASPDAVRAVEELGERLDERFRL